jgi:hypothetical protein
MAHRPVTMRGLKKLLASVMVLGAVGSLTVSGTYGLLNSEGSNPRSFVASGTLTFTNVVNTGTTCYSYSGPSSPGNVNSACQPLFTPATENYPGAAATAQVTIANNGSLDAADLSVYMPSCTATVTPSAPSPGGANPCGVAGAQLYVQETDLAGTPTTCWFPSGAGACPFAANSLFVFQANDNAPASALGLGAGPSHGQSRYFVIGMRLASNASNGLQGQAALFSLRWHVTT